jgi:hypothetical protein
MKLLSFAQGAFLAALVATALLFAWWSTDADGY